MKFLITILAAIMLLSITAQADCVYNAKDKTSFVVLDSHTIMLTGGPGPDIIIKVFAFVRSSSSITVLKDSFCSYDSDVLVIDGTVEDVRQVTKVN